MSTDSRCPQCGSDHIYHDGNLWICPACNHETVSLETIQVHEQIQASAFVDAFGNVLQDGDTVTVIKDLKVRGSSNSVKVGTKVKNIRLVDSPDGHNIACKIEGWGAMNLKSEFVKKV